jgi:hypothetical protein
MTTDPSNGRLPYGYIATAAMKAFTSLLKKRAHAEMTKQCGERSDSAIRSRSQWVQQQTTRPR